MFLMLLPDMSAVTADSDEQAYYFISKDEKNMVGSLFSLRSCSFIMLAACRREKLLHAWAGVASTGLLRESLGGGESVELGHMWGPQG